MLAQTVSNTLATARARSVTTPLNVILPVPDYLEIQHQLAHLIKLEAAFQAIKTIAERGETTP